MIDMIRTMPMDGSGLVPSDLIAWQLQLVVGPWAIATMLVGWTTYGLGVWFAALDARELARRGFDQPFHWAWAFLSNVVYVIGRHVVVRRRGGRGAGPLVAAIATQTVVLLGSVMWSVLLTLQIMQAAVSRVPFP